MKACKHSHVLPTMFHQVIDGRTHACRADFCEDCNVRLPLGEAHDADPNVAIEIRAAEIAVGRTPRYRPGISAQELREGCGWVAHESGYGAEWCSGMPDALAGYLARVIATHGGE